jgi:cellulose biosynthesis protein BcsQ
MCLRLDGTQDADALSVPAAEDSRRVALLDLDPQLSLASCGGRAAAK